MIGLATGGFGTGGQIATFGFGAAQAKRRGDAPYSVFHGIREMPVSGGLDLTGRMSARTMREVGMVGSLYHNCFEAWPVGGQMSHITRMPIHIRGMPLINRKLLSVILEEDDENE
jgi:hypothetical protein